MVFKTLHGSDTLFVFVFCHLLTLIYTLLAKADPVLVPKHASLLWATLFLQSGMLFCFL